VPQSVAYHRGFGSFGPQLGVQRCDHLATRNTLLFAWKNLSGVRLARHLAWLPVRVAYTVLNGRLDFFRALVCAAGLARQALAARRALGVGRAAWTVRQELFFRRFQW
jgi:hypothetical protein